tara:strand:- start:150 stop:899 length:750 start_codon:yes stop_codon:yes gene_type:complete
MKYSCLFVVFFSLLTSSCTILDVNNKEKVDPPVKSFVKIVKEIHVSECHPNTDCRPSKFYSTGSGIVVGHTKKNTIILTAAHVCRVMIDEEVGTSIKKMEKNLYAINHLGKMKKTTVILASNPSLDNKDMCLIASPKIHGVKAVKLGPKPKVGDMTFNIAAPAGVVHLPAVPILHGIYSGEAPDVNSDLYTIPAIGGSSGSGIFNEDYELIGLVFASVRKFHHVTLSPKYDDLKKFLDEGQKVVRKLNL